MKIKPETLDVTTPLEEVVSFLEPQEGAVSEAEARRFHDYPRFEGESDTDYLMRVCSDILTNYYNVTEFSAPMVFGCENPSIPGIKIRLMSQDFSLRPIDFCARFPSDQASGTLGCVFAVFQDVTPGVALDKELPSFFTILPKICAWSPWERCLLSPGLHPVFTASLVAPEKFATHFITDCIVRFLDWAKETRGYVATRI